MNQPKHILFASVLKTVSDVRMWHKMGKSALAAGGYTVSLWGKDSTYPDTNGSVVGNKIDRQSWWKRICLQRSFFKDLQDLQPDIVVVCTFELLVPALIYRIANAGSRLVYDVRENYMANAAYATNFSWITRMALSWIIGLIERLGTVYTDQIWVAESCYIAERSIMTSGHILPNYALLTPPKHVEAEGIRINFLITGTLGRHYGTLEAIRWFKAIKNLSKEQITLTIAGYAADNNYAAKIRHEVEGINDVELLGIEVPVPYEMIDLLFEKALILLLPYLPNRSTRDRVPTKYYEAKVKGLQILLQKGAFPALESDPDIQLIDFLITPSELEIAELIHQLATKRYNLEPNTSYSWQAVESKYLACLDQLYRS